MYCLWNGEYGEHDLSFAPALETTLKIQEEQYKQYVGCIVGDWTCLKVEYDWGRRDQRWTIKCNLCGEISYQYHTQDWRRGKGRKLTCDCRKKAANLEKEKKRLEQAMAIEAKKNEHLGKVYYGWEVIEYNGYKKCGVKCRECGTERKGISLDALIRGDVLACNHKMPTNFTGEEWIGKKSGRLTVKRRDGVMFVAQCDCGREIRVRPTDMFTSKRVQACNDPNCKFATYYQADARKRKKVGYEFERDMEAELFRLGYPVYKTRGTGDFGVDLIVDEQDGSKIAIQCKKQLSPAGVGAVQEVYAGGRFYDCDKFAVICETGFSNNAIRLAQKLGVYLCYGEFRYPENMRKYCADLKPVYHFNKKNRDDKLYEMDGERKTLSAWGAEYGVMPNTIRQRMKNGMAFEDAVKSPVHTARKSTEVFTVCDFNGTLDEICKNFGVLKATVQYRMRERNMTLEEAVLSPKMSNGRQKKECVIEEKQIDNWHEQEAFTSKSDEESKKNSNKYFTINGETKLIAEWCRQYGVSVSFVQYRIKTKGMSPYEALTTPKEKRGRPKKRAATLPPCKTDSVTTRPTADETTEADDIIAS